MTAAEKKSPPKMADAFAKDGPLSRALPGYEPRPAQIEMAQQVAAALDSRKRIILEAGPGVGKTFAYLAPILLSGGSALISTGTRALQDQLFQRDLPAMRKALGISASAALLKGRANYLCRLHLQEANQMGGFFGDKQLAKVNQFARRTEDGDISKADAAKGRIWDAVISTRENCVGQKCEHYKECFFYRARERARRADIVVVNHHLFLADLRLRDEGVAEILPRRNAVIFDEAHLLPELATQFFGEQASTMQLSRLARDCEKAAKLDCPEKIALQSAARMLGNSAAQTAAEMENSEGEKIPRNDALQNSSLCRSLAELLDAAESLAAALGGESDLSERLARCRDRALAEKEILSRWLAADSDSESEGGEKTAGTVRWMEQRKSGISLHSSPLEAGEIFSREAAGEERAAIFTSATLAVDGEFDDFRRSLGLDDVNALAWQSPFDYEKNALLFLPPNLPPPNSDEHTQAVIKAAAPLIRASRGRAFLLFASLRAMRRGAEILRENLGDDFYFLTQGDSSPAELLRQFRRREKAVLLGSYSFWVGVDVKGEALSLVVVDKIPFIPPDDPVMRAREQMWKKRGESPFLRTQLPVAVMLMKQAAGRLIRDSTDKGVLALCDPRLLTKNYGRIILNSLPPMKECRDSAVAENFLLRV